MSRPKRRRDAFSTFTDELRDGSLMVRNSMLRVFGHVPQFTDREIARVQAALAESGPVRACNWCGEPTYGADLCASCQIDEANGADGPDEVTL